MPDLAYDLIMDQSAVHHMYFVAILCPDELDKKIFQFKQWMKEGFGCMVAKKSPAHITLIPPFWLEEEREKGLLQTLNNFQTDMDELEIQLNGFSHFGKRVLFVRVNKNPGLEELKIQTENHFCASFADSIKKDDRHFHPHVTIATRDIKPSHFMEAWEYFRNKQFTETFRVKTISLLKLSQGKWNVLSERSW